MPEQRCELCELWMPPETRIDPFGLPYAGSCSWNTTNAPYWVRRAIKCTAPDAGEWCAAFKQKTKVTP
jgi:hypothetical protein